MLVSVYIRKADEDKWRKLTHKTEAIHKLLHGTELSEIIITENEKLEDEPFKPVKLSSIPKELEPRFCKNGHPIPYPKENCMGKGCKYS